MDDTRLDPLFGAAPKEIPLPSAPLVGVVCQVRFTEIISIEQKSFIAAFQERVRSEYPLVQTQTAKTVNVDVAGASVAMQDSNIWRFMDPARTWRLSLTPTFLALETKRYTSRADFVERLGRVVDAAKETLKPTHILRIGIRYVDRIDSDPMATLLREELTGVAASLPANHLKHSISEILYSTLEGILLVRWGMLPAGASHDPDIMPSISTACWFLDLDSSVEYQTRPVEFDGAEVRKTTLALATRAYAFFRWAIKDRFLAEFGGQTT